MTIVHDATPTAPPKIGQITMRQKAGVRGQNAGSGRQEAGGRRQEAGGRRQVAGGRRQVVGGRRQEAGGRRQECKITWIPSSASSLPSPCPSCSFRLLTFFSSSFLSCTWAENTKL